MSGWNSSFENLPLLDLYYISVSSNIFLYGIFSILVVGLIGNTCQILTFSRKTMRNISTGVLFLALSISDTVYLLSAIYILLIYGFQIPDRSDYGRTCQFRHFINTVATNFSAWILATIACDRWFRSRFPHKSKRICTPRIAIYFIIIILIIDCALCSHLLTPMFGKIVPIATIFCGANRLYPNYVYFYINIWPTISILTLAILPASCMLGFILAIAINVANSRNRVVAVRNAAQQRENRRAYFLNRQMLILMLITVVLFFLTTFPFTLYRFVIATLGIRFSIGLSFLLPSIFSLITLANYSFNFYLHSLTSKLFRKQFFHIFPCPIARRRRERNIPAAEQHQLCPR